MKGNFQVGNGFSLDLMAEYFMKEEKNKENSEKLYKLFGNFAKEQSDESMKRLFEILADHSSEISRILGEDISEIFK